MVVYFPDNVLNNSETKWQIHQGVRITMLDQYVVGLLYSECWHHLALVFYSCHNKICCLNSVSALMDWLGAIYRGGLAIRTFGQCLVARSKNYNEMGQMGRPRHGSHLTR